MCLCSPSSSEQLQLVSFSPISGAPRMFPADRGLGQLLWVAQTFGCLFAARFSTPSGALWVAEGHALGTEPTEQLNGWKTRMGAVAAPPAHKQARLPRNRSFPRWQFPYLYPGLFL